jgi:putative membrane protein insertion efficiency factor
MEENNSPLQKCLIAAVKFYRLAISSVIPPRCGFEPTCSSYAIEAIKCHGSLKGCWLTLKRLLKCHPLSSGGYDPVPTKTEFKNRN